MSKLIIAERDDIVAIADAVRNKTGIVEELTIGGMIDGINSIVSGGGIDTSDATATSNDIATGKTAYVDGEKIIGTHECEEGLDTSDATAIAEDIMSGKTAYVNGEKVTGTFTIDAEVEQQNTKIAEQDVLISQIQTALEGKAANTGIDTSDATATADDIATGKTAYVNGVKVIGTHECSSGEGGSSSYDTCTLYLTNYFAGRIYVSATVVNNGVVETTTASVGLYSETYMQNVLCGSWAIITPPSTSNFTDYIVRIDGEESEPSSDNHIQFVVPNKKDNTVEVVVDVTDAQ